MTRDKVEFGDFDYSHRNQRAQQRQMVQTGGIFSGITSAAGSAYDTVAGAGDFLSGSTDEAIARQFDDKQGGGVWDGILRTTPLVSQSQETSERQAEEGIIPEDAAEPEYIKQSSASLQTSDNAAPPGGTAVQNIRIGNGVAAVNKKNPNRRPTGAEDAINKNGAAIGIGGAAAAAGGAIASGATAATAGSFAGPPGIVLGAVGGVAGSLLAGPVEEFVGALGYTATAFINGQPVGQTVGSVGVPPGGIGQRGKTVQLQHTVPQEPGKYKVRMVVNMWQTGEVIDEMETTIVVEEGRENNVAERNKNGNNNNNNQSGNKTVKWATNNPIKAGALGIGGLVALRTAVESGITGE